MRIRPAQAEDEAAIRACAQDAYGPYIDAIGRAPAPMVADFAALIAAGSVHVAIGEDADLLGFIVFHPENGHVLLESVAVRQDTVGQGIGKGLIAFCEAEAQRLGASSVRLYTNVKMTANLSIYPHLGYRETDRRREGGFDRVYFEKPV